MGLGSNIYDFFAEWDGSAFLLAVIIYIVVTIIFSKVLKTNHKSFWWMFFLTIPVGAIITILLDIKDNTSNKE